MLETGFVLTSNYFRKWVGNNSISVFPLCVCVHELFEHLLLL